MFGKDQDPKIGAKTQFQPGQSGNEDGRPKKLPDLDKLLADVLGEEKDGKTAAEAILMALRAKAAKGDIRAAEVLLDRGYGKAVNRTELSGINGTPLPIPAGLAGASFEQLKALLELAAGAGPGGAQLPGPADPGGNSPT
jgi:hypothetical protein